MSRTKESRGDGNSSKQMQEIEELERRIKKWTFDVSDGVGSLPEVYQVESRIKEVISEENADVVLAEAEQLLHIMDSRRLETARRLALLENEVLLLETEVQNKIIHRMDTEDIKYSIYRLLLTKEKIEIFSEAAEAYRSIVESLKGIKELEHPQGGKQAYLPAKKIIQSDFYAAKVKARLCYEACYRRLLQLNREDQRQQLEARIVSEFLRYKILCSSKLS